MKPLSFLCLSTALVTGLSLYSSHEAKAEETILIDDFVVSPNRTPLAASKIGATVVSADRATIERSGATSVETYLATLPGVSFSRDGGPGQTSTVRLRGLPQQYTKVLIDGIDMSDPSGVYTTASFADISLDEVERIEILQGAQGGLYGGNAVAGVISITTSSARKQGVSHDFSLEAGSYQTVRGAYGLGYANDRLNMRIGITGFDTEGFSAADRKNGNTEKDGASRYSLYGKGDYVVSERLTLFANFRATKSESEYDASFPTVSDAANEAEAESLALRIGARWKALDDKLEQTISLQGFAVERTFRQPAGFTPFSTFEGTRQKLDYLAQYTHSERVMLMGGFDAEQSDAVSTGFAGKREAEQVGGFMQGIFAPVEPLTITLNARYDWHDAFGSFSTYRAQGAYEFAQTGTTVRASLGTGFRVPSLDELYASYGNPNLKPEESLSLDFGISQSLMDGRLVLGATYFRNKIDELIIYDPGTSSYSNLTGETTTEGVELTGAWQATDKLSLNASYTYTYAKSQSGARQPRVPEHAASLTGVLNATEKLTLSATLAYKDGAVDNAGVDFGSYFLLDGKASYALNEHLSLTLRGENLLDEQYQTSRGYGTAGRSAYVGVKGQF